MAVPNTEGSGVYGLADDTGSAVFLENVSMNMTTNQSTCRDHTGETVGLTVYDEKATYTASYFMKTADTHLAAIGAATNFANDGIVHIPGTTDNKMVVTGLASTRSATDYQRGTLTALHHDGITPA